ncbi:MAG: hypothetical protein NG747_07845 [Candidatus Brocadia sp.]|nr:hypothetical protein [Candidatus Brocadia sp.]
MGDTHPTRLTRFKKIGNALSGTAGKPSIKRLAGISYKRRWTSLSILRQVREPWRHIGLFEGIFLTWNRTASCPTTSIRCIDWCMKAKY